MPEKRLEGQRAVVTGASAGIGTAIAVRFASEGASIWADGGKNEGGLKLALKACRATGVRAEGRPYDFSDGRRASEVVSEGAEFLGGIDILVNCDGARSPGPVTEFSDEEMIRHRVQYNFWCLPNGRFGPKYDPLRVAQGLTHIPDDLTRYARAITCPMAFVIGKSSTQIDRSNAEKVASCHQKNKGEHLRS